MGFCNVHQGWIDMKSIHLLNFKIAHSKLLPYIPENKDLIGLANLDLLSTYRMLKTINLDTN